MPSDYYESISDLLPVSKVPSEVSSLLTSVSSVLSELHYKDFVFQKSSSGDAGYYALTLAIFHKIECDLPARFQTQVV